MTGRELRYRIASLIVGDRIMADPFREEQGAWIVIRDMTGRRVIFRADKVRIRLSNVSRTRQFDERGWTIRDKQFHPASIKGYFVGTLR